MLKPFNRDNVILRVENGFGRETQSIYARVRNEWLRQFDRLSVVFISNVAVHNVQYHVRLRGRADGEVYNPFQTVPTDVFVLDIDPRALLEPVQYGDTAAESRLLDGTYGPDNDNSDKVIVEFLNAEGDWGTDPGAAQAVVIGHGYKGVNEATLIAQAATWEYAEFASSVYASFTDDMAATDWAFDGSGNNPFSVPTMTAVHRAANGFTITGNNTRTLSHDFTPAATNVRMVAAIVVVGDNALPVLESIEDSLGDVWTIDNAPALPDASTSQWRVYIASKVSSAAGGEVSMTLIFEENEEDTLIASVYMLEIESTSGTAYDMGISADEYEEGALLESITTSGMLSVAPTVAVGVISTKGDGISSNNQSIEFPEGWTPIVAFNVINESPNELTAFGVAYKISTQGADDLTFAPTHEVDTDQPSQGALTVYRCPV